jgi:hypothetical protein
MARKEQRRYRVRIREFLNRDPEYPAFVIGIVEDTSIIPDDDKEESWRWGDVSLDLGDCFRRVSFDFQMETHRERANSLNKINRIARAVNAVRDAIEEEVLSRNARPRTRPNGKKS